jgi:hypothetical protein
MKKSSLFISGILTTFILTLLVGAISAYRTYTAAAAVQPVVSLQPISQTIATTIPTVTAQPTATAQQTATTNYLTPQQGAQLAASYLGRSDLYSVEGGYLYGLFVYKVTFSSGDVAFVSQDGQVLRVVPAPSVALQNSSGSQPVGGEHEGGNDD